MKRRGIYVEIVIRADLNAVWKYTQDPVEHVRWDIRFSSIVPVSDPGEAYTQFRYSRTVPFHTVHGWGTSVGESSRADGTRTSALRFCTEDRLSPIRAGRGYWRYVPTGDGVRFITGYDYDPGWGLLDVLVRPVLAWATAWSFDRLRVWLEGGTEPESWPLISVLWWWRPDRPRASRCHRSRDRAVRHRAVLDDAPASLASLAEPRKH